MCAHAYPHVWKEGMKIAGFLVPGEWCCCVCVYSKIGKIGGKSGFLGDKFLGVTNSVFYMLT